MRHCLQIAAVITTIAVFEGSARAGVSDDLVFCSKLSNSKERIACYDAAARIAANGPSATSRLSVRSSQPIISAPVADTAVVSYTPVQKRLPFQGAYVSLGGAYGLVSPHSFGAFDSIGFFSGTARPSGASAVGAAGYNLQFGHFIAGLELSGRYGSEKFSDATVQTANQPLGLIGQSLKSYSFNIDSSAHLATRLGLAVDQTMIFGKFGAGIAHQSDTTLARQVATGCNQSVFVPPDNLLCTSRVDVSNQVVTTRAGWTPSLLFGLGLEQNFGPAFGRIEAEAEAIRTPLTPDQWLWTVRALASIGVRF